MLSREILIRRDILPVYQAFADLAYWQRILDDVLSVRVHYQDPVNSEFSMTVARPSGPETVRGIRYFHPRDRIEMVHLTPPPDFQYMRGLWSFSPAGQATRVTAQRWFSLKGEARVGQAEAGDKLSRYLESNLARFKTALEA